MIKAEIYQPREDSFLLSNSIIDFLKEELKGKKVTSLLFFDIGCGSGFQTKVLMDFCKKHNINLKAVLTDVNANALKTCMKKFKGEEFFLYIVMDALSSLRFSQNEVKKFDLVIFSFNPPYLPEDEESEKGKLQDYDALISGKEGTETIAKFLKDLKDIPFTMAFFVTSSLANTDKIFIELRKQKYRWQICKKLHIFFEDILVISIKGNYHAEH